MMIIRRIAGAAMVAVVAGVLFAAPASADRPIELEPETNIFFAPNPCTGGFHQVTINVSARFHDHRNGGLLIISTTGSTSDGFVIQNGRQTGHYNAISTIAGQTFMDRWVNPETGQKFRAAGVFVGEFPNGPEEPPTAIKVDRFSLRCIGGPTILP